MGTKSFFLLKNNSETKTKFQFKRNKMDYFERATSNNIVFQFKKFYFYFLNYYYYKSKLVFLVELGEKKGQTQIIFLNKQSDLINQQT